MKKMQSKNHRIGTYENNKISLSCFDDKINILNHGVFQFFLLEIPKIPFNKKLPLRSTFSIPHPN